MPHAAQLPGVRRLPAAVRRIEPDVVLFESWHGLHCDNPRAISEELHRRGAPLRKVWVLEGGETPPDADEVVRPGSTEYLAALGRARYIVSANTLPGYFRKKRSTTYVHTWNGTPLKRIGLDVKDARAVDSDHYLRNLRREAAGWDYLIS